MTALDHTNSSGITPRSNTSTALAAPAGHGAAGQANVSMARMIALLSEAMRAMQIFESVGLDLRKEANATEEMANYLTASFGERISLEQIRVIADMLVQIAEGTQQLINNGHDAVRSALMANFRVLVAQEALHSTGADGAYIDSQRRAG